MVTTINSLPLELIRLILASAYPFLPYDEDEDKEGQPIGNFYFQSTALVCSAWRLMSQELLWERVVLNSTTSMAAFAEAPRLPSKSVIVSCPNDEVRWEELSVPLKRVLEGVRGVERLSVSDLRVKYRGDVSAEFKLDCISGEGFKDLKRLKLDCMQLVLGDLNLVLPFALDELTIGLDRRTPTPPSRLLAILSQPSLKTFRLSCALGCAPILHNLVPMAPPLHTLELNNSIDDILAPTFLRACGALQHLQLGWIRAEWLEVLPSPLVSLSLDDFDSEDPQVLVELIKDGVVGVSKLQRLKLKVEELHRLSSGLPEDVTEEGTVWRELANICREKGIKITETLN